MLLRHNTLIPSRHSDIMRYSHSQATFPWPAFLFQEFGFEGDE